MTCHRDLEKCHKDITLAPDIDKQSLVSTQWKPLKSVEIYRRKMTKSELEIS